MCKRKWEVLHTRPEYDLLCMQMLAMRADIAFAVSTVSQFMLKAGPPHWMVVKHIMRYLKGTLDFKFFLKGKYVVLRGFCNADWARDANNQQSIIGYEFFVGIGVILWKCKKKPTIALSTIEAEYMVTSYCIKETIWLWQLLVDVEYVQKRLTSIMCNNQGCITLAKNPTHHSRSKHIDVQHHFIRVKLKNQDICLKYCHMGDMIADVLTKPLANDRHQTFTKAMDLESFDYSRT